MTFSIINRRVNPLLKDLPEKFERIEPHQVRAIDGILRAFSEHDVVVLDAPTGSGKTLIGEVVRKCLQSRALYLCSSLSLQDQFVHDFPYSRVVKGRVNYPTELFPQSYPDRTCDDCTWTQETPACRWCARKYNCPYEVAKIQGIKADLAVVNMAYALTEWNGPGRFSGRDLVIVDEADVFESAIQSHISVELSARRMRQWKWKPPKITVQASWKDWLDEHIPQVASMAVDAVDEEESKRLGRLYSRLATVRQNIEEDLPYAFTGRDGSVGFKPVVVGDYCEEAVWKHGKKWLLMSATTVSSDVLLRGVGWRGPYATISVPSTFPKEHRQFVVKPVANMSRSANEYGNLEKEIRDMVEREPGRVVVHCVSYSLTRDISASLAGTGRVVTYNMAGDRAAALAEYIRTPGSVLVAPSADRGIDLPDELCRLQIIAKVPYPNLGDRMVNMRMHMGTEGQTWYTASTVRTIVQMAGRGVRHKDDWCKTVILDSQFATNVWLRGRGMFPGWFKEAMVWQKAQ